MQLQKLNLLNYKNFSEISFEFNAKINCFIGLNGIGKTNILDSIYHLAYGKSYFNAIGIQNIRHDQDFFVIEGEFLKDDRTHQVVCSLKKGQKKILKKNGKIYDKFSEHIGFIPLVIISPSDNDLISEGSEVRRKFLDQIISQLDVNYLNQLIKYQRLLSQRNALLKYFHANSVFDKETLAVYDEQLDELGSALHKKRTEFLVDFTPIFSKYHSIISGNTEQVSLVYQSQLFENNLLALFQESIQKDRAVQYTSVGIHKDDLSFEIEGYPIKKFGSQGQQKSFLIALKLAQFEFVKQQNNVQPILLFDDVFDKLDKIRVGKIIDLVNQNTFGQIFISDTDVQRTENIIKQTNQPYKLFNL
jgi:DNA replication and repair protein RecF